MSYVFSWHHMVFGTKNRQALIAPEWKELLFSYIAGIARNHEMQLIEGNGLPDHVHLLLSLPATIAPSKAANLIKSNCSRWVREKYDDLFGWQREYASFSISPSQKDRVIQYIRNQEKHHTEGLPFKRELVMLLRKHGVPFDPKYLSS